MGGGAPAPRSCRGAPPAATLCHAAASNPFIMRSSTVGHASAMEPAVTAAVLPFSVLNGAASAAPSKFAAPDDVDGGDRPFSEFMDSEATPSLQGGTQAPGAPELGSAADREALGASAQAAGTAPAESEPGSEPGQKPGWAKRVLKDAGKHKEEEKEKPRLDAPCAVTPVAEPAVRRFALDVAEPGDRYEPEAGVAAAAAGPTYSASAGQFPSVTSGTGASEAPVAASGALAFSGRLVMAAPDVKLADGSRSVRAQNRTQSAQDEPSSTPGPASVTPKEAASDSSADGGSSSRDGRARLAAEASGQGVSSEARREAHAAEPAFIQSPTNPTPPARSEHSPSAPLKTADGPAAPVAEPEAKDTAAHGPARQIALELNNGDARVDVRVSERRGEVVVSVRTPDARLAGDLRGDLPSLAARLEQTGLRAAWHSDSGFGRQQDRAADPQSQDRGTGGGGGEQRRREDGQQEQDGSAAPAKTQNRKDFAWFMTSLG